MIKSAKRGLGLLACYKKAVVFAYAANLGVALLLAVPMLRSIDESFGDGLYDRQVVESIDHDWLELFRERASGAASTFSPAVLGLGPFLEHWETLLEGDLPALPAEILLVATLYLVLNAFLNGAFLGSLSFDPQGTVIREYFRTGGEFFGRFLRMALLAASLYILLQIVVAIPLGFLLENIEKTAETARSGFYWRFSFFLLSFPLVLLLGVLVDYAKIILAAEDRTSVLLALFTSCAFFLRNLPALGGLYLILSGAAVLWLLLYAALENLLPQGSGLGIAAAFAVQQAYLAGRLAIRHWFYSAQFSFYLQRR